MLNSDLFPFQRAGVAHLLRGRARLLADEMGLGKTLQALRAAEADPRQRVTVLCPAIMCAEWESEWATWHTAPRSVAVVGGKADWRNADVAICSFDRCIRGDVLETLRARTGAHLIVDEAHYLKELGRSRTTAVLGEKGDGRDPACLGAAADRISLLTGTPAPNHAGELFPILATCGVYDGSYWQFFREFCTFRMTEYGPRATGYKKKDELRALLHAVMLRRTNAVELPPTDRGEILVEPAECGGENVLAQLRQLDVAAAGAIKRAAAAGDFSDLETPHMSTLRRLIGLAKVEAVAERAAELLSADPSAKLVLFCIHKTVIELLTQRLSEFGPVTLQGGESDTARRQAKERFQMDPATRVAVCQMKAAGTGLTLTAGNHLWIVEPSWTPADNDQAVKRIVRIGQKRSTSIRYITLTGSIDEAVNAVLRKKRQLVDLILQ